jgi:hypothetical protein
VGKVTDRAMEPDLCSLHSGMLLQSHMRVGLRLGSFRTAERGMPVLPPGQRGVGAMQSITGVR